MDSRLKAYVAGFFDGEGNVSLQVCKHSSVNIGYKPQPVCGVTQRGDSEGLIEKYKTYCDSIGCNAGISKNDSNNKVDIRVYGFGNVEVFLSSIIGHLTVKERQADIMLNQIVPAMKSGRHKNKVGFLEIMEMKERLDENKSESSHSNRKYNKGFFNEMWDVQQEQSGLESW